MQNGKTRGGKSEEGAGGAGRDAACYFCGEEFEMGYLQRHLSQCGSILEQCPRRCGAWLQRRHAQAHVKQCSSGDKRSAPPTHAGLAPPAPPAAPPPSAASPRPHTWAPDSGGPVAAAAAADDCLSYLEKAVADIKMVLTEEVSIREAQGSELAAVRQHVARLACTQDNTQHDGAIAQLQHDLQNVQLALEEVQGQQSSNTSRITATEHGLLAERHERQLLEAALEHHHHRVRALSRLEEAVTYIKTIVEEERAINAAARLALDSEVAAARRASGQLTQLVALREQLGAVAGAGERAGVDRLAVLEVWAAESRAEAATQIARAETLARDLKALTKSYHKLRSELTDFQTRVSFGGPDVISDDGRLIWRIDKFSERMREAKESDTVLCSPLFRTSKYGYTLKAEVQLNGIGRWRGRHITATARLAVGPHDPLLQWPCDLAVNVVLRDQPPAKGQAMDIVKSLQLRRKSSAKRHDYDDGGSESRALGDQSEKTILQLKRQYIFIPHTSLDKFDYIKDDVMFMEFIVKE